MIEQYLYTPEELKRMREALIEKYRQWDEMRKTWKPDPTKWTLWPKTEQIIWN